MVIACLFGCAGDVITKKICANVPDVSQDPRFMPALDNELGTKTRCMICAPIICQGVVLGVLQASNKKAPPQQTPRSTRSDFNSLQFTASEAMVLNYIAATAGLALAQSGHPESPRNGQQFAAPPPLGAPQHDEITVETYRKEYHASLTKLAMDLRGDQAIQSLVQHIYSKLDAERVSMFTYSAAEKNLFCALSQDIQGLSIPSDKGYAGLAFTAMRIINVADAKADGRHNGDVDSKIGYTTRNLLCAPIVSSEGVPLGVMQAVNKKSGAGFTIRDEQQLIDVCKRIVVLLRERGMLLSAGKSLEYRSTEESKEVGSVTPDHGAPQANLVKHEPTKADELQLAKSVCRLMTASTLAELVEEAQRLVLGTTDCDYTGLYALESGTLVSVHGSHDVNRKLQEIPPVVKQALQFGTTVEFSLPPPGDSGDPHDLIPGLSLQQALIYPLTAKVYPYKPGTAVLVVGRRAPRPVPVGADGWTARVRARLDTVSEYVNGALTSLSRKMEHNDGVKLMKAQYNLVNNSLGALRDFVILLNDEGRFIGSNKVVEELLGHPAGSVSPTPSSNGSQKPAPPGVAVEEGRHYTEWLNKGNSPQLIRDIDIALRDRTVRSLDRVKFFSAVHPNGILIDYQIVPIENPELRQDCDIPTPRLVISRPHSERVMPHDGERVNGINNCALVVVIHTENFHHHRSLGPSASHAKIGVSFSQVDPDSAHGVVDAAASIVANVRASFALSEDVATALKTITESLNNASRRMSIMGSSQSAIQTTVLRDVVPLVSDASRIPADVFEWEFNVLEITDGLVLCSIIGKFFETLFNLDEMGVDASMLARYIAEVGKNYHDRPFHNLQHSTCVSHFAFKLLTATEAVEKLTKYQQFAILVSAVVHDVDHPGNTNLFEVNSGSELALRYNDSAVLENHHCSTAFRLMRKPNMQILSTLPQAVASDIRKMIISCVMATDMAVHFELIDETKRKALDGGINFAEAKEQTFLGKILLHAADLSNPVRPFHMTREWARRISLEFNDQVTREEALGMPVLSFMMTPNEKAFCKNEMGFASFVVAPMWRAMSMLYPQLNFLVEQIESNVVTWKESMDRLQAEEDAAAAAESAAVVNS
jgi:GAF domain-containing protein